mgnify:CR=1 FL=1
MNFILFIVQPFIPIKKHREMYYFCEEQQHNDNIIGIY